MRVAVIPTGKLELLGLKEALESVFPTTSFFCVPAIDDGIGNPRPFNGFTSSTLPILSLEEDGSSLAELVGAMASHLDDADLVVVVDDLELFNVGNEQMVVTVFREAVERYLQRLHERDPNRAQQQASQFQRQASFHLAVPMIESWLFADPTGSIKAGASKSPRLRINCDPEDFETADINYSADDGSACTKWYALPKHSQKKANPEWLKPTHRRERHPKRYMSWLCHAPSERNCSTYDDTKGSGALRTLDWKSVLANPKQMTWLRSLITDLADGLGVVPKIPVAHLEGDLAALTSVHEARPSRVLRNL